MPHDTKKASPRIGRSQRAQRNAETGLPEESEVRQEKSATVETVQEGNLHKRARYSLRHTAARDRAAVREQGRALGHGERTDRSIAANPSAERFHHGPI